MTALGHAISRSDAPTVLVGAAATLAAVALAHEVGSGVTLGLLVGAAGFAGAVGAFLKIPHVAFALVVPLFAVLPAAKVLALPSVGPLKDAVVIAAGAALAIAFVARMPSLRRLDPWVAGAAAALLALYVLNVGGGLGRSAHDVAWAHGVRLIAEPLILLLAGMALGSGRRTFRWTMVSLVATGFLVATYGLAQQAIGQWRLVEAGYSFDAQVRTINGHLRSFGTMDEPFAYATFLVLALVPVAFFVRNRALAGLVGAVILAGIAAALVRSAALPAVALVGLVLASRRRPAAAMLVLGAVAAAAATLLFAFSEATETRTVRTGPASYLTLNGRVDAWQVVLRDPSSWVIGHGVGEVGTAADRARRSFVAPYQEQEDERAYAVDSGYLATVADVGLAGLLVLLTLFARLAWLGSQFAREGAVRGWMALGFLATVMLDAITRDSFNAFPTAFVGLLVIGLALSRDEHVGVAPSRTR